jgi:hypothetical protein
LHCIGDGMSFEMQRRRLRHAAWLFAAAVAVALVVVVIAWATDGPPPAVLYLQRFPVLVLFNFIAFGLISLVASVVAATGRRWRWAEQWLLGAGALVLALLPAMALWPELFTSGSVVRWQSLLAAFIFGGCWALAYWVRRTTRG